jgi:sugar O-acyltransferase (sialic acid O-acetyltransferase NeuD family)
VLERGIDLEKPSIVLIGLSGNTLEILEAVQTQYAVAGILSDDPRHGDQFEGIPVTPLSRAKDFGDAYYLFLIGSEKSFSRRQTIIDALQIPEERYARVSHLRASVSGYARLGHGTVLYPGVIVTSNAVLGNHVMVLPNSVIHHDVTIGACSIIGSNVTISGSVKIGRGCYVGSASSIRNGISIGDGALIGMAANVVKDVPPGAVMVGNPARQMRDRV